MADARDSSHEGGTKQRGHGSARAPEAWIPDFIDALSKLPNVRAACQHAGVGRSTVYIRRAADEEFAALWDEAIEDGLDRVEQAVFDVAVVGDPRTHRKFDKDGNLVSETIERRRDVRAMELMLKAYRPAKFRERFEHRHTTGEEVDADILELAQGLMAARNELQRQGLLPQAEGGSDQIEVGDAG